VWEQCLEVVPRQTRKQPIPLWIDFLLEHKKYLSFRSPASVEIKKCQFKTGSNGRSVRCRTVKDFIPER
jgi:hypothetical protein